MDNTMTMNDIIQLILIRLDRLDEKLDGLMAEVKTLRPKQSEAK